ncbi:MAG: metallophosphoesterase [Syntrophobacteraceae bacterium]
MLTVSDLISASDGKLGIKDDLFFAADSALSDRTIICVGDLHLLEKGPNDDFFEGDAEREKRLLRFLDFLLELRQKGEDLQVIQIGDMYDLWQAKANTNMVVAAYPNLLGKFEKLKTAYVIGNHDIDIIKWHEGVTFGRTCRFFTEANGKKTVIYEHGFQADVCNDQDSLSGEIGRKVTEIVGCLESIDPDIDIKLGNIWDSFTQVIYRCNNSTPAKYPERFPEDEYISHYRQLLANSAQPGGPGLALKLAVFGHTHQAKLIKLAEGLYLMDCGAWVNGRSDVGIISGKEMAICRWA